MIIFFRSLINRYRKGKLVKEWGSQAIVAVQFDKAICLYYFE